MRLRVVAACVAVALSVTVPLQPLLAQAQQTSSRAVKRNTDGYDVGAAIMTVVGAPLKGAVCLLGGVAGGTLFLVTFGSADRASAAVVREGCDQRWVVRGDDIRPDPYQPSRALLLDPDPQAGQR
ncbi:MAG TPA: hypothetical protein VFR64_02475 [Methylomirabilota bacterium]|nr:hypothetical protein [Methylomirabilota bacterium]